MKIAAAEVMTGEIGEFSGNLGQDYIHQYRIV